jgi:hypothetical protein
MPTKWAPPSVVRTIDVQTGLEQGACPSNQNCWADTAVNDTGEKPAGTGPPGGAVAGVVVVVELVDVVELDVVVDDEDPDRTCGASVPAVVVDVFAVVVEELVFAATLPPHPASSTATPARATTEYLFTNC